MLLIAVKKGLKFVENLTKLNLDNYKPLRDVVFENLREAILEGKLKPGQRLMEVQLAEQLGVSRTPVREAIRKLELEGLVVMLPRKGAYVANMSLKDIMDVLEVRASLEGLAAYLAAERISDEDIKKLKDISEEFNFPKEKIFVTPLAAEDIYKPMNKFLCKNILKEKYNIEKAMVKIKIQLSFPSFLFVYYNLR